MPPFRAKGGTGAKRDGPSPAAGWKYYRDVPPGMLISRLIMACTNRDWSHQQRSDGRLRALTRGEGGKRAPGSRGEGVPSQELPVLLAPAPVRCLASEGGSFAKLQHEAAWSLTYRFVLAVLFSDLLPGSEHFCCRAVRSQAGVVLAPALPLPSAQLSLHNRYIEIHLFFFPVWILTATFP